MKRAIPGILITAGLVLVASVAVWVAPGDDGDSSEETHAEPTPSVTPAALTEYDSSSALLVKGRDHIQACVEVLDGSVRADDARAAVEEALLIAATDSRWPERTFGTPTVDAGCPLPPIALDSTHPSDDRPPCRRRVTPYLAFIFVGDASLFEKRYPETHLRVSFPVAGIRRAVQEKLASDTWLCAYQVAEAWYLTPEELEDDDLLQHYIFGLFPIAEICC